MNNAGIEGRSSGLFKGTITAFVCRNGGKSRKASVEIEGPTPGFEMTPQQYDKSVFAVPFLSIKWKT